jgi:hypothetical protein
MNGITTAEIATGLEKSLEELFKDGSKALRWPLIAKRFPNSMDCRILLKKDKWMFVVLIPLYFASQNASLVDPGRMDKMVSSHPIKSQGS